MNVVGIGRPRSRTRIAVSPRTAASCDVSARASRGTVMLAGSMVNGMTTRAAAPQVAITTAERSAATPTQRWEIAFIPRGDFHMPRGPREDNFPGRRVKVTSARAAGICQEFYGLDTQALGPDSQPYQASR